jgi:hypothetical protein
MKLLGLISEMINIVSWQSDKRIRIHDSSFSNSSIDYADIGIGCTRILNWIYYEGNDPSHHFWIERSGHLEKNFLEFMNLNLIKEFFTMENGNFALRDSVPQNEANTIRQFVKENYKPKIFID